MPPRTLTEAKATLDTAEGLSDEQRRSFQHEIAAAETQLVETATSMVSERVAAVATWREEALADMCGIRDDLAALVKEAATGPRAADYAQRLNALQAELRGAQRRIAEVEQTLTFVEAVEADPVAYGDSLLQKFPLIRPDFSL